MFINDIFKKKTITESLRQGEYYTFQVFFDDGTDETLNFSSDDIDWDRVGAKRGKQVVDVERLGGIQGSQSDNSSKPHEYSDDRGLARAQRAYDQKIPEGGFDIPEIPRAPTPKPPKEKDVAEESPYMDNRPSSVTAKQADQFGGAAKRAFKPEYYEPDTEPAPKRRNWDYNDPDVKSIVDKYLNDKILDKKPMTYKQDVPEGSVQDRLHRRHQEIRKKAGRPDPDYYKELKASYDIENDQKRLAQQAEIKKKYRVAEGVGNLAQALDKMSGGYWGWHQDEEESRPDLDVYHFDDGEGGFYATGIIKHNLRTDKVYVKFDDRAGYYGDDVDQMFPNIGAALKSLSFMRPEQDTQGRSYDVLATREPVTPDDLYKSDRVGRKGALSGGAANRLKDKIRSAQGRLGPKGELPRPKPRLVYSKQDMTEGVEQYLEEMRRAGYDIVTERATLCPECGGPAYEDKMLAEKQDACYHKVKSRYKVWPSAYASGALVRCRKVGAKNWGNKSKK